MVEFDVLKIWHFTITRIKIQFQSYSAGIIYKLNAGVTAGLEIAVDTLAISGQIIVMSGQNQY